MTLCIALARGERFVLYADKRVVSGDGAYNDLDTKIIEVAKGVHVATAGDCQALSIALNKLSALGKKLGKMTVHQIAEAVLPEATPDEARGISLLVRIRRSTHDDLYEVSSGLGGVDYTDGVWSTIGGASQTADSIIAYAMDDVSFDQDVPEHVVSKLFAAVASNNLGVSAEYDTVP